MQTKHSIVQPQECPIPHPWELNNFPDPNAEDFNNTMDEGHAPDGEGELREWEHHSILCGVYHLLSTWLTCSVSLS
jgi:hypothetical protein